MAAVLKKNSSRPFTIKLKHLGLIQGLMDSDKLGTLANSKVGKFGPNVRIQSGALLKLAVMRYLSGDMPGGLNSIESFALSLPVTMFADSADFENGNPYQHANRYALADLLDRIAEYGPSQFTSEIISELLDRDSVIVGHLDSTSYHLHGHAQYNHVEISVDKTKLSSALEKIFPNEPINITQGYSRDNRPDLPQVNHLAVCARTAGIEGGVVLHQAAFDGNMNDNARFQKFCEDGELNYLKKTYPKLRMLVADSAAANAKTVKACEDCGIELVTRISDSRVKKDFEKAQSGVIPLSSTLLPALEWEKARADVRDLSYAWLGTQELKAKDGTSVTVLKIMFVAESMRNLKTESITRKAEKELKELKKSLDKLKTVPRSCQQDAERDFKEITAKLKYVTVTEPQYDEVLGYASAGRPKAGSEKKVIGVKVYATASINEDAVKAAIERELYYVVATTNTKIEQTEENARNLYLAYHGQSDIESQWKDIKATGTFFDSIYLHNEGRIRALLAVVTIALYYARKLMTYVRKTLQHHSISLSLANEPACTRPSLKTFIRFASSEKENTDMILSRGLVWLPEDFESSIIYLIAKEIGDEAIKYYSEDFYLKNSDFIYDSIKNIREILREDRSLE